MESSVPAACGRKRRQRAWRPKSRTGCTTCKIRRIKCDETRPSCDKCTSTGRKCDGYTTSPATHSDTSTTELSTRDAPIHQPLHEFLALQFLFESKDERESFDFFRTKATTEFGGFFASPFWQREVLQAVGSQAGLRYGVIALGAMHRRYSSGTSSSLPDDASDKLLRFALVQSNRAIRETLNQLNGAKSQADMITLMTSCVLFANMACLQGHQKDALKHVRSGLNLLQDPEREIRQKSTTSASKDHPVSMKSLEDVFRNLEIQARGIMSSADLESWGPKPTNPIDVGVESFSSLDHARQYFEALYGNLLGFLQDLEFQSPPDLERVRAQFQDIQNHFKAGNRMLADMSRRIKTPTDPLARCCINFLGLLRSEMEYFIHHFLCRPSMSFLNATGPSSAFDEGRHFSLMMDMVFQIIEYSPSKPKVGLPTFSSNLGLVPPLFLVAKRGPDLRLRKKAIDVLLAHPRRESVWDGTQAGLIAREAMTIELANMRKELKEQNSDLDEDTVSIPDHLKISSIGIHYTGTRSAKVEFRTETMFMKNELGWARNMTW
ncbi:hypothetical protein BCR34DRAFT_576668 [Clohesyomyces aquaticus]|uniref:Zn(2)-C6 fungal-type domain-containing protein n=1 Tax=Clohesyomyces aquaticus TaxID=1231657 RepID=A0A1Y1YNX5_9PLEO|nr:hypothetical protein BCR34DRAFT_576668 [Clohesyomyces aquaticus]